jgi:ribokinase
MSIVVFGSINMDLVVRTPQLPAAGETITGHDFFAAPGGKGANQAVACARLEQATRMVGRIGNDVFAGALLDSLRDNHVDVTNVLMDAEHPSGVALISVDDASENTIVVVPGANGSIGDEDVSRLEGALNGARVLLLQFEIPMEMVVKAAWAASERGIKVILDPAPAQSLPSELYENCAFITPNEIEAGLFIDFPVRDQDDARRAASVLLERGVNQVIIKMGGKGAYWCDGVEAAFFPAYPVDPVDTVAAGDAFNGGLAVGLADGLPVREAINWGMAAGALSTTRQGAQPSMPDRQAVENLIVG